MPAYWDQTAIDERLRSPPPNLRIAGTQGFPNVAKEKTYPLMDSRIRIACLPNYFYRGTLSCPRVSAYIVTEIARYAIDNTGAERKAAGQP